MKPQTYANIIDEMVAARKAAKEAETAAILQAQKDAYAKYVNRVRPLLDIVLEAVAAHPQAVRIRCNPLERTYDQAYHLRFTSVGCYGPDYCVTLCPEGSIRMFRDMNHTVTWSVTAQSVHTIIPDLLNILANMVMLHPPTKEAK